MGNVVNVSGTLTAGPAQTSDTSFPTGVTSVPFAVVQRAAPVQTGAQVRLVNSAGAYVPLDGVGTGETVTKANLLYLNTKDSAMWVRLTFANSPGSDVVSELPVKGPAAITVDETHYLKLVEAKGTGTIEYYASGNE